MIFNSFFKTVLRRGLGFKFKPATSQIQHQRVFRVQVVSKIRETLVIKKCKFHTTPPRNALPPAFVLILRFVAKIVAMVSGRVTRKWWRNLSPEEREKVLATIQSKKNKIAFAGGAVGCGIFLFYMGHIVEDPFTKRRRFIILSQKQMNQIGEYEYQRQMQLYKSEVVPESNPIYRRVLRVANSLVLSNMDLQGVKNKVWSVTVVDKPDVTNAFALPNGKIFVFTGILNVCTNDDQLAIVLAHEIAHSILGHVAENLSRVFLIDFLLLIPTFFIWMVFPDMWAIFSDWVTSQITKIFLQLPFSRAIEKEADMVGLHLAARSCFDVREAPVFWWKMKFTNPDFPFQWLSTHPSHESRQVELRDLVPEALKVRELSKCPPLAYKSYLSQF